MVDQDSVQLPAAVDKKPGPAFYVAWILWTVLSIPAGYAISIFPLLIITIIAGDYIVVNGVQHITEDYLGIYVVIPMIGLVTGTFQYLLLRQYMPRMGAWIWATLGGWLLGFLIIIIPGWLIGIDPVVRLYLLFPCLGLGIGLLQWLVLRRRFTGAWIWIAASLLGWFLVAPVLALTTDRQVVNGVVLLWMGFFPGCTTAAALWWMGRKIED